MSCCLVKENLKYHSVNSEWTDDAMWVYHSNYCTKTNLYT